MVLHFHRNRILPEAVECMVGHPVEIIMSFFYSLFSTVSRRYLVQQGFDYFEFRIIMMLEIAVGFEVKLTRIARKNRSSLRGLFKRSFQDLKK